MAKKKEPVNTIERDGKIFTIMNTNSDSNFISLNQINPLERNLKNENH